LFDELDVAGHNQHPDLLTPSDCVLPHFEHFAIMIYLQNFDLYFMFAYNVPPQLPPK
jgi:hypothetical protein